MMLTKALTVDLAGETTTANADTDVNVGELLLAQEQQGLQDLVTQHGRLNGLNRGTVHTDQTRAALAMSNGDGMALAAKALNRFSRGHSC
jgi:hypothetical protein